MLKSNTCRTTICALLAILSSLANGEDFQLDVRVFDAKSKAAIPARLYLQSGSKEWHCFDSLDTDGSAVRYEKQNWINKNSIEYHTTVSAHPCRATIPAGKYVLTVESGKSYFPREVDLSIDKHEKLTVELTRWNNPASRKWYSGDTLCFVPTSVKC